MRSRGILFVMRYSFNLGQGIEIVYEIKKLFQFYNFQHICRIPNMIAYCPPNVTLSEIWTNNGISHCFVDTVSTSVIAGLLLIFGSLQLFIYRRYATRIEDDQIIKSKLYNFQIFLSLLVPVLSLIRFMFQVWYYDGGKIYGFMVRRHCEVVRLNENLLINISI